VVVNSNEPLWEGFAGGQDSRELSKVLHRRNHDLAARQLERETSPPNPSMVCASFANDSSIHE